MSIYELVRGLSHLEHSFIEAYVSSTNSKGTLWWKLFEEIKNNNINDNQSASQLLYASSKPDSRISHTKKRLESIVLSCKASAILFSKQKTAKYAQMVDSLKKYLVSRQFFENADYELESKYLLEASDVCEDGSNIALRLHWDETYLHRFNYRFDHDHLINRCRQIEQDADRFKERIELFFKTKSLTHLTSFFSDSCTQIPCLFDDKLDENDCYEVGVIKHKISAGSAVLNRDSNELEQTIISLEDFLAKHGVRNVSDKYGLELLKGLGFLFQKKYSLAQERFLYATQFTAENGVNKKTCFSLYAVSALKGGGSIPDEISSFLEHERKYYELYLISLSLQQTKSGNYSDAYMNLNQCTVLFKYRRTWRVVMRILESYLAFKMNLYDQYVGHLDSLRKLVYSIKVPYEYEECVLVSRKILIQLQQEYIDLSLCGKLKELDAKISYSCSWFLSFTDLAEVFLTSKNQNNNHS